MQISNVNCHDMSGTLITLETEFILPEISKCVIVPLSYGAKILSNAFHDTAGYEDVVKYGQKYKDSVKDAIEPLWDEYGNGQAVTDYANETDNYVANAIDGVGQLFEE